MREAIVFLDIDTQYDFMRPAGRLYVKGAEKIIPNLKRLFRLAEQGKITIISSLDTHKDDDPEFKIFPAHCIKGTRGYNKIKETITKKTRQVFILKHTFDVFSNPKIKILLEPYEGAFVFGVALDYCVKAACSGLLNLGIKTYLVSDATQAVSANGRIETLKLLRNKGVLFASTEKLIKKLVTVKK